MMTISKQTECRHAGSEIRMIVGDNGKRRLEGYAAVFNSDSQDLGGFIETIKPGAFSRSLTDGRDLRALYEHNDNWILARQSGGTLILSEDDKGLRFSLELPDTTYARDCVSNIEHKNTLGCSFLFYTNGTKDRWYIDETGITRHELIDIDTGEITITNSPAYTATSVSARSLDKAKELASRPEYTKRMNVYRRLIAGG